MASNTASFDLHMHSHWSFDSNTPPELYFEQADQLGLTCIAITDHYNLDAQPELSRLSAQYSNIQLIRGAEFTVRTSYGTIDLLVYGFPLPSQYPSQLVELLKKCNKWTQNYGKSFCQGMTVFGFEFSEEEWHALLTSYRPEHVLQIQGNTRVMDYLLYRMLRHKRYIRNITQYYMLLEDLKQEFILPEYPSIYTVLEAVRSVEGIIIILAHPHRYFKGNIDYIDQIVDEFGLDGLECAHSQMPANLSEAYRTYCIEHGLLLTGGSDCHLKQHIDTIFGQHTGQAIWLDEFLERL